MQDNKINPILLYGTSDCHLCDEAMNILQNNHIAFEFIDITHDNNLVEQLGWFIPVIKYQTLLIKSPIQWSEVLPKLKQDNVMQ